MLIGDAPTAEIANGIKLGVPPQIAAAANGVSESEFVEWMRKGHSAGRGEAAYRRFYAAVRAAEATCEATLVGRVRHAASANWNAAAWMLERLYPERYVRRSVRDPESGGSDAGAPDPFAGVDSVVPIGKAKSAKNG